MIYYMLAFAVFFFVLILVTILDVMADRNCDYTSSFTDPLMTLYYNDMNNYLSDNYHYMDRL